MKPAAEILKKQEVHQVNISGIVYEMVKFAQAEKAMLEYADATQTHIALLEKKIQGLEEELTEAGDLHEN